MVSSVGYELRYMIGYSPKRNSVGWRRFERKVRNDLTTENTGNTEWEGSSLLSFSEFSVFSVVKFPCMHRREQWRSCDGMKSKVVSLWSMRQEALIVHGL